MPKALIQFNDYVSLAVMLLMLVALLGGRSSAGEHVPPERMNVASSAPFSIELEGQAGAAGVTILGETGQFRGEDE